MDRIGRYVVAKRLGSGGFATVYRAEDPILEFPVAVKVLSDHAAGDPDLRARFINEARVMRRINSARIATVYDIAELPDGRPYLVMQLASRGTLHDRLRDVRAAGSPVPVTDLLAVVRGLGDALGVVHDAGVVHRDVKPSNVLIDVAPGDGEPDQRGQGVLVGGDEFLVLADFGIAKQLEATGQITSVAGTAAYMAPEQRVVGAPIDGRADVYAATAMVAELVTGLPAAAGPAGGPAASTAVQAALTRGLAEDPGGRPADARAWSKELTGALREPPATQVLVPTPAPPPAGADLPPRPPPGPPAPPAPPGRRRRWLVAGLGVGLAAAAVVAVVAALSAWWPGGAPGPTIVGPRELLVGQQGGYYVEVGAGTGFTWTTSAGATQRGGELTVAAQAAGELTVSVRTEEGAESTITVSVSESDGTVSVDAPHLVEVGEVVTFRPQLPDGTASHWIDGDGFRHDTPTLVVETTSAGTMTVHLVAELDGGRRTVSHPVTVVPVP